MRSSRGYPCTQSCKPHSLSQHRSSEDVWSRPLGYLPQFLPPPLRSVNEELSTDLQHHLPWRHQNWRLGFTPTGSNQTKPTKGHELRAILVCWAERKTLLSRETVKICFNLSRTNLQIRHIFHSPDSWIHNVGVNLHIWTHGFIPLLPRL